MTSLFWVSLAILGFSFVRTETFVRWSEDWALNLSLGKNVPPFDVSLRYRELVTDIEREAILHMHYGDNIANKFRPYCNDSDDECITNILKLGKMLYGINYIPMHVNATIEDFHTERFHVIDYLQQTYQYKSYLEIGCYQDRVFRYAKQIFDRAHCVDPVQGGTHRMTSDEYFQNNTEDFFDLIFVDGLHEAHQAFRDVQTALRFLRPGGTIMMHDSNPLKKEWAQYPEPNPKGSIWNGDVWKAVVALRLDKGLEIVVGDFDHGVALIRRRPNKHRLSQFWEQKFLKMKNFDDFIYEDLAQNRHQLLRLMPIQEVRDWLRGKPSEHLKYFTINLEPYPDFIFTTGDNLEGKIHTFIKSYVIYDTNGESNEKFLEIYINIFLSIIVFMRKLYPVSIKTSLIVDSNQISFNVDESDDYEPALASFCLKITQYMNMTDYYESIKRILQLSWNVVDQRIRSEFREALIDDANAILENEKIVFVYDIPEAIPTGLGNVLKGFISFFSVHSNTKIRNFPGYVLGNYSSILDSRHIYDSLDDSLHSESITTFRWILTADEDVAFYDMGIHSNKGSHLRLPDNPVFAPILSRKFSIDGIFDLSLIPKRVYRRIMKAVRLVRFNEAVVSRVADIVDALEQPSIGVSVRSYRGVHETSIESSSGIMLPNHLTKNAYFDAISSVINTTNAKSLLIAFDNHDLVSEYSVYLKSLPLEVHYFPQTLLSDSLLKGVVEILSLSETNYLIGDSRSSFLEVVYWFGKCRQKVFHPSAMAT